MGVFWWFRFSYLIFSFSWVIWLHENNQWKLFIILGYSSDLLNSKKKRLGELAESHQTMLPSKTKVFISAFITSILNPKTGFFVVSLFSASMSENMSTMMILAIMLTMFTITLCWHLFLVMTFSHESAKSVYGRISGVMGYVTGGLFTLFGIKIMTSS